MALNYFDLVILCILALFTLRGLFQGFVAEVAGIAALISAFWCAHHFYALLGPHLRFITDSSWQSVAAYILIFLAVMLGVGLLARLLRTMLAFSFIGWIDKLAGGALGLFKGALILALLLILVQRFFGDFAVMKQSQVLPYLNTIIELLRTHMPADLASRLPL